MRRGISRTLAIVIALVIIIVAIGAGLGYYYSSRTPTSVTTTPSTSTLPISTTPITIGAVSASHPDMAAWAFMESNISSTLKEYDPNINFEDFPAGSSAVIHAVESGSVQIGIAGTDAIVVAISQGAPLVIVATFRETPAIRYVVVKSTSNIMNLNQLNGTISANSAPGSLDTIAAEYLELSHHLHFKLSYVGSFSAQIAAVVSGAATFTNIGSFDAPKLIENGTLRVIYNFTYPWPMFSIFTTRSFLEQHPDVVKAAVMAILMGDQIYEENTNNITVNFLINYYKNIMEPSYAYNVLFKEVKFSTNGAINATAIQVLINTYRELGIITNTTITANDTYTNEFVPIIT
ncbi:hypothetical protein J5U23_01836 [Saccharolobus shibatae B12]|uniref:SsuA/THI5-like domain-containing protein n=1 Tax=Saccharolobus shibatae (strain ATCC 51178 / DSM 5389 / JCM 8931 / NBRC 15437 / B12) TaxID=523848 RepID=A0A8F5GU25_SACSH|nr:ABC transporter substrate-binding protein [Saccharolobus shibatae]QXJ28967.1 hypothetical protein J5U23_01836 [Saccharolobus shibatae B12]